MNKNNNNYIVIIDIGIGNVQSIINAINYNNMNCVLSNKKSDIINSSAIILPGVGAFNVAMDKLKEYDIDTLIINEVKVNKKPILGICLGMQMLFNSSTENIFHNGLGLVDGSVEEIKYDVNLPHVGWNNLYTNDDVLYEGISDEIDVYFDHSYHVICDLKYVTATCLYEDNKIISSIRNKHIFGVQYHPEKSQHLGLQVINNFIKTLKSKKC